MNPQRGFVKKEKLKRIVAELVAEELKNSKSENDNGTDATCKLRHKFVENVSLMGLTEAIKSKHRVLKIVWAIIFMAGLIATSIFVYRIAREYRDNPTATKVSVIRSSKYAFPPVVLCLDTWLDARKAYAMGLSKEAIRYALTYLMLFEDVGDKIKQTTKSASAQREFYKIYETYNFTSLIDFYKYVAVDITANSDDRHQVTYTCNSCDRSKSMEKVVMNREVCHRIVLDDVDGKLRQSSGLPRIRIQVPNLSDGLVPRKGYWKIFIKPLIRQPLSASPFVSIYPQHSTAIKITSERHDMLDKPNDPCIANDPTTRLDRANSTAYSSVSCALTCARDSFKRLYNCTILNLDSNFSTTLNEYCNSYFWKKWPPYLVDYAEEKRTMRSCVDACPHECSVVMYDTSVDSHESNKLVSEEAEWKNNNNSQEGMTMRNAKIYFINAAVLSGGVITYQEVFTYSFDTLVGNIGGTCGIWIGASIMTLIQLMMFVLEQALNQGANTQKKLYQTYKIRRERASRAMLV